MAEDFTYRNVSIYNPVTKHTIAIDNPIKPDFFKRIEIEDEYTVTEADVLAALANHGNLNPSPIQIECSGERGTIAIDSGKNFLDVYRNNLIANHYAPFVSISTALATGTKIMPGLPMNYNVTIKNTTQTSITNLEVHSSLLNESRTISLSHGASNVATQAYDVTEDDIYQGTISETISVHGTSFASTEIQTSKTVTYYTPTLTKLLTLTYIDAGTGKSRGNYGIDEAISYKAVIRNAGNVTIHDILFHDNMCDEDKIIAALAPDETAEYDFETSFQESNSIENIDGTVSGYDKNGESVPTSITEMKCYIDYGVVGWAYTVQVSSATNKKSSIPFSLYGQSGIELSVDWGDGTTSFLTSADYPSVSSSLASVHTYAEDGIYTIQIDSNDWENTYICSYGTSLNSSGSSTTNQYANTGYFKQTVVEILTGFPALKGTNYASSSSYSKSANKIGNPFQSCSNLRTIPQDLFSNFKSCTTFAYCFSGCSSLEAIPSSLFSGCTSATTFRSCFQGCTSLTEIPDGLFSECTKAGTMWSCFQDCTSLTSIPENLFALNTSITDFDSCFQDCSALGNFTLHIGTRTLSYCSNFVTFKSGTTRIVYVPSGSNTQSKFENIASSLDLTVIGE